MEIVMSSLHGIVPPDELMTCSDQLFEEAKQHLLTKGVRAEVALTLFVGRMDLGEGGEPVQLTIQQFDRSSELLRMGKDWFALMVHKLAESGASDAVIVLSEAWGLELSGPSMTRQEALTKSEEAIEEYGGSLKDHPDRTECLMLAAFSRTHDYYRQETMIRDSTGKVTAFQTKHKSITPRGETPPTMESRFRPPSWGAWMSIEEIEAQNRAVAKEMAKALLNQLRGQNGPFGTPPI
jgi:hypothetical protein